MAAFVFNTALDEAHFSETIPVMAPCRSSRPRSASFADLVDSKTHRDESCIGRAVAFLAS
jgi:hypothetical protein